MSRRILGIDPGLQTTGFGVVETDGPRLRYLASGTIRTKEAAQGDLPNRLRLIFEGVREVVARYDAQGVLLVQSARCGASLWRSDEPKLVQCERDQGKRYWHHVF